MIIVLLFRMLLRHFCNRDLVAHLVPSSHCSPSPSLLMHSFTYSHVTEYTGWASPPVQPPPGPLGVPPPFSGLRAFTASILPAENAFPSTPSAARCFHSTLHPLSPSSVTPSTVVSARWAQRGQRWRRPASRRPTMTTVLPGVQQGSGQCLLRGYMPQRGLEHTQPCLVVKHNRLLLSLFTDVFLND